MKTEDTQLKLKKKFVEKYVSKWMVDDGNNKLLWKDKAPTPNEMLDFIHSAVEEQRKEIEKEIGEMKQQDEMQEPRLFQSNPTIKLYHEWGGYSSVPFYCSLCGMSEVDIQDNKIKEGYHCNCSVWTNSCGGEWIRWFKGVKKARKIAERFYPNVYNQALQDVLDLLKKEKWGLLLL